MTNWFVHGDEIWISISPYQEDTNVAVADGLDMIPIGFAGNLYEVVQFAGDAGTTGTQEVQVRRRRVAAEVDMLSTKSVLTAGDQFTDSAVIDAANDDVIEGDRLFIDVDTVNTTPCKGLSMLLKFKRTD